MSKKQDQDSFLWMSYSDLSTALLLSFILIFVVAKIKTEQSVNETNRLKALIKKEDKRRKKVEKLVDELANMMNTRYQRECANIRWEPEGTTLRAFSTVVNQPLWFTQGRDLLLDTGKRCLQEFAPIWLHVFHADPDIRKSVSQMLIEGHTNSRPFNRRESFNFIDNLELSQNRAFSAAKFVLSDLGERRARYSMFQFSKRATGKLRRYQKVARRANWNSTKQWARNKLAANGRGFNDLLYKEDRQEDEIRSIRVEFEVILKTCVSGAVDPESKDFEDCRSFNI